MRYDSEECFQIMTLHVVSDNIWRSQVLSECVIRVVVKLLEWTACRTIARGITSWCWRMDVLHMSHCHQSSLPWSQMRHSCASQTISRHGTPHPTHAAFRSRAMCMHMCTMVRSLKMFCLSRSAKFSGCCKLFEIPILLFGLILASASS